MTNFEKWIAKRPALSIRQLEKDAKLPATTLYKFVKGYRVFPKKYTEQLIKVLKLYGYNDKNL